MNELAARWVAEKSWTYSTTFQSPPDAKQATSSGDRSDLVFKGLDTYATVTLNGSKILEADNMFLEYRVDVTDKLKPGDNELEIVFASALLRGRELVAEHEHEHKFIAHQTELGRMPVRKAQCHWGWDWGPILVTSGPWRPIFLETYTTRVEDVWFQAEVSKDLKTVSGKLLARVDVGKKTGGGKAAVKFSLSLDGTVVSEPQGDVDSEGLSIADFKVEDPALWYPHGYGKQPRYELKAILILDGSEQSSQTKLTGFRKIELVQEKDEFGKSFYFRINNVDVFAGGSCWIPADSFIPRIGRDGYRKWMELMVDGNQIMTRYVKHFPFNGEVDDGDYKESGLTCIRIWGGGIYEEDDFYDACDELGILVWQDFAFACASYPTYPSFLQQIEVEARHNVRRLRTRPSLAIWAGNNEDYQIQERYNLDYDYDGDKDPESWLKGSFPARYIYEYQLPKLVKEEDPGAVYHPSSPWGDGKKTFDPTVGDIHQWNGKPRLPC
jgi:beta-mannosidase